MMRYHYRYRYSHDSQGNVLTETDPLGNITAIAPDAGRTTYTYDRLGRLTDAEPNDKHKQLGLPEEHYLYDKVGNRTASAHQNASGNTTPTTSSPATRATSPRLLMALS